MGITINKLQTNNTTLPKPHTTMKVQAITLALFAIILMSVAPVQARKVRGRRLQTLDDDLATLAMVDAGLDDLETGIVAAGIASDLEDIALDGDVDDLIDVLSGAKFAFSLLAMAAVVFNQ